MKKLLIFSFCLFIISCQVSTDLKHDLPLKRVQSIEASSQLEGGNADKGFQYLTEGGFVGTGFPFDFLKDKFSEKDTVLNREGDNANVPYLFNVFEAENGVKLMSGNCFACHASSFDGDIQLGLGDSFTNLQKPQKFGSKMLRFLIKRKYKPGSPEREAHGNFSDYFVAIQPKVQTPNFGVNAAFRLEEACVAYRNPEDLSYTNTPIFETSKYTLASDVPPLWNVKKKNALYYNGMGRGDETKLLMQASVLGVKDTLQARQIQQNFVDVRAWLNELEAPKYPKSVNPSLVEQGKTVFEDNCMKCHGTYNEAEELYPNKLVSVEVVKTDPHYAAYFLEKNQLVDWYNKSWFATTAPQSSLTPSMAYMAPPLDGVWATAPYLHNGSVPTLDDLLNSKQRPTFWTRSLDSKTYDYEKVGWQYTVAKEGSGEFTYDTTLKGYGNQGHYFGDKLSKKERKALIEYLKTL